MAQFTFNSRDTYTAYRADWRARYKALSQLIRQNKRDQVANRGNDNSGNQSALHYLRVQANRMMVELREAKEFKNEQLAAAVAEAA